MELSPLPIEPAVSVVTAAFNDADSLAGAVRSVHEQTRPVVEHIVVDDGSTDHTPDVLAELAASDPRVRSIRTPNRGQTAALNLAVAEAVGDIVLFLDADDRFRPRKVEAVIEAFHGAPKAGLLTHRTADVRSDGRVIDVFPPMGSVADGWLGDAALRSGGFLPGLAATSGLGLRREVADRIFPLPSWFRIGFDTAMVGVATLVTEVVGLDDVLTDYVWSGRNAMYSSGLSTSVLRARLEHSRMTWQMQREFLLEHEPDAVTHLQPLEASRVHMEQRLVLSRLERDGEHRRLYAQLRRTPDHHAQPLPRRAFWTFAPWLPRPVFLRVVSQLYRPSALRGVLASVARTTRGGGGRPSAVR